MKYAIKHSQEGTDAWTYNIEDGKVKLYSSLEEAQARVDEANELMSISRPRILFKVVEWSGRWILRFGNGEGWRECSECGARWKLTPIFDRRNFCHKCGARMVEKEDEL